MANFLFSSNDSADNAKRKYAYPSLLGDLSRSANDAIEALDLFRDLIQVKDRGPESLGFMAFDAHAGDTGCHLRAGMFLETCWIYRHIYENMPEVWSDINQSLQVTIDNLQAVSNNAQQACSRLTKQKQKPSKVGLHPNQDTPRNILTKLGWTELGNLFPDPLFENSTTKHQISSTASSLISGTDKDLYPKLSPTPSRVKPFSQWDSLPSTLHQASSNEDRAPTATWDVFNSSILIPLIVISFILSKYKRFSFHNNTLIGRMEPKIAEEFTVKLMEPYWDRRNNAYKNPGLHRLEKEFRDLQSWLSDLSCAWLLSLSKRSSLRPDMTRLLVRTIQKSPSGLAAAACYPSYLLQREFMSRLHCPIILVDRHFCANGYHINVFVGKIIPSPISKQNTKRSLRQTLGRFVGQCLYRSKPQANYEVSQHLSPLGLSVTWDMKRTSIEELLASEDQTTPHFLVIGNSIDGNYSSYTSLVLSSTKPEERLPQSRSHLPDKETVCQENEAHNRDFLATNHDRLALSTFAVHPPYPFPLASGEEETKFVEKALDVWEAENFGYEEVKGQNEMWRASREEGDYLGSGRENMRIFRWQHVCVETKGRLGRLLEQSLDKADLLPLKARFS